MCCECVSLKRLADFTCLCLVTVLHPGLSDGQEVGLSAAYTDGTVSAAASADLEALHPQGDHPEVHGRQHRRGALRSQQRSYDGEAPTGELKD